MKKILFFIDSLGYGGAEKVLVNLLNRMDRSKYDITLLSIFDSGVNLKYLDQSIRRKYIFKKVFRGNVTLFKLFTPQYLYKKYIQEKYDVIISFLEGNTTRILSGCPYKDTKKIAWIHVEMNEKSRFHPYRSKTECFRCYQQFDRIVGVSKNVVESFESHLGHWDTLCVKYNTVDTDYVRKASEEKIDIVFSHKVSNLVSVGRLVEQKSYMRLLKIHKRLLEKGYNHRLYILGEGVQKKMLQNYIEENNLNQSAILLGFKDNPWAYVAKADFFVCSSWKEGFSTAVTEALIVGTPVITTRCSGMEELLGQNNEYGIITENDEAALEAGIEKLLSDKRLLEYYAERAQERGKKFETAYTVQAVEEMIDELFE